VIEVVTSVAALWANLAYLFVTSSLLLQRLRGWPARGASGVSGLFSLGKWGLPVNLAAVVWGIFTVVNIGWPRPDPDRPYGTYAPLWFTAGLLAAGLVYYVLFQRHKPGTLAGATTHE
jgi:hypothetical protein